MRKKLLAAGAAAFSMFLALGCAHRSGAPQEPSASEPEGAASPGKVTLELRNMTVGDAVRQIGQETGASIALAYGLHERPLRSLSLLRTEPKAIAAELALEAGLAHQHCAGYDFLFAEGLEPLTRVQLSGQLHPRYEELVDGLVFGAGVPLYVVFAWAGQGLGVTVVADDAVSQADSGEVALAEISLAAGLEAILKAARVARFETESTADYVFLYAPGSPAPPSACLNRLPIPPQDQARFERRVSLCLPHPPQYPGSLLAAPRPRTLESLLPELSRQLGIPVAAEEGLEEVPINPVVMNEVPLKTALDLLVRRWLTGRLGWQLTRDRIVLRRRTQMDPPPLEPAPQTQLE